MLNVGISAMSGITNLTIGEAVAIPELRRMCYGAVAEAVPVAQADGVELTHEESREVLDMVIGPGGTGGNKSSLCVDMVNRRPTEIDVINGAVVDPWRTLRDRDPDQRHAGGAGEGTRVPLPHALILRMSVDLQEHLDTASAPLAPPPLAAVRDSPRHRPSGQLPGRSRGGEAVP